MSKGQTSNKLRSVRWDQNGTRVAIGMDGHDGAYIYVHSTERNEPVARFAYLGGLIKGLDWDPHGRGRGQEL